LGSSGGAGVTAGVGATGAVPVGPGSGDYIVPGALVPVTVDCGRNEGRYVEPNVWMKHKEIEQ